MTDAEIAGLARLVEGLNAAGAPVVVEGMRDSAALRAVGYAGRLLEFHGSGGMPGLAERAAGCGRIILLFDCDRKGRQLEAGAARLLSRKAAVDLSFARRLRAATRGRVRCVEELAMYADFVGPRARSPSG